MYLSYEERDSQVTDQGRPIGRFSGRCYLVRLGCLGSGMNKINRGTVRSD